MSSLLELSELLSAVKGQNISTTNECIFTSVQTDSRNVTKDTLFVPLIGEFQDGHKYIPQAVEKGASVIFVDENVYESNTEVAELPAKYPAVTFVTVKNTLHALQDAAEAYVNKVAGNMIHVSITGSSGKTTTKEMMVSVCREHFGEENICYTKGNFNSETGLPLSVFNIKGTEKIGIFEMGMNRENEIGEISKVWKSKYGIITNIGTAHIGILGSRENIAKEKRKSFDYVPADGAVFVPVNDDFADYCCENVKGKVFKYGKAIPESQSGVKYISDDGFDGTTFTLDGLTVKLPLNGEYNFENAMGVVACAREIGIPAVTIKAGLENMPRLSGRMEKLQLELKNGKKVTVLKDCYNANLESMLKAIDFVSSLQNTGKKVLVLADMKELGDSSKESHVGIAKKIIEKNPDEVILAGSEMKYAADYLKENNWNNSLNYFDGALDEYINKAAEVLLNTLNDNDVVLLKGSHSMSLEKLIPCLEKTEGGQ